MNRLCLQLLKPVLKINETWEDNVIITLESFITLFIHQHVEAFEGTELDLVLREDQTRVPVSVSASLFKLTSLQNLEESWSTACELPVLYKPVEKVAFSGICCICR